MQKRCCRLAWTEEKKLVTDTNRPAKRWLGALSAAPRSGEISPKHDGIGMSLYAKRLERGRFLWPSPADGIVAISAAQLAYMLDGIDWRNPVRTWRPEAAG